MVEKNRHPSKYLIVSNPMPTAKNEPISTPMQFDCGGKIQIWKNVCFGFFFFKSLVTCHEESGICFNIVCCAEFVALNHCNKRIFLFLALSHCIFCICLIFSALFGIFCTFCGFLEFSLALKKTIVCFDALKESWQCIHVLFVTVTQCNQQKFCLLQWLSVTNNIVSNIYDKHPFIFYFTTTIKLLLGIYYLLLGIYF